MSPSRNSISAGVKKGIKKDRKNQGKYKAVKKDERTEARNDSWKWNGLMERRKERKWTREGLRKDGKKKKEGC